MMEVTSHLICSRYIIILFTWLFVVDEILFGKITHLYDPAIQKMSVRGSYGNREFRVPFWSMIYEAMKLTLHVSEIEFDFNSK